jgi:hypothetical protein
VDCLKRRLLKCAALSLSDPVPALIRVFVLALSVSLSVSVPLSLSVSVPVFVPFPVPPLLLPRISLCARVRVPRQLACTCGCICPCTVSACVLVSAVYVVGGVSWCEWCVCVCALREPASAVWIASAIVDGMPVGQPEAQAAPSVWCCATISVPPCLQSGLLLSSPSCRRHLCSLLTAVAKASCACPGQAAALHVSGGRGGGGGSGCVRGCVVAFVAVAVAVAVRL